MARGTRHNDPTTQHTIQNREVHIETLPHISGRWCFTDGSWKEKDKIYDKVGIVLWKILMV